MNAIRLSLALVLPVLCTFVAAAARPSAAPADKADKPKAAVSIKGMAFNPETVKIKVGDTVRWTNDDDRDHTVTSKDDSFKSEKLGHGDTFDHQFKKAGKFPYACSYHPRMKGVVVVGE